MVSIVYNPKEHPFNIGGELENFGGVEFLFTKEGGGWSFVQTRRLFFSCFTGKHLKVVFFVFKSSKSGYIKYEPDRG